MNNFDGQLNLYPEICIDNFSSNLIYNPKISLYILTHFHDDHMNNLEDMSFSTHLKSFKETKNFFTSTITKKFLQNCFKYSHLSNVTNELACETPILVKISDVESVVVTFCGSGHCPGSVMVFIEGERGNVLFTGDFRLTLNTAKRLPFLKTNKQVNDLYIDMTFFKPEVKYIPSREDSVRELIKFIENYLKIDNKNFVYLKTSARIGYEFVYREINRLTRHKIHVNDSIYKLYDQLPEVQDILTLDPFSTKIHSCINDCTGLHLPKTSTSSLSDTKDILNDGIVLPCYLADGQMVNVNACKIVMSTMWFTDNSSSIHRVLVK